MGNLKTDEDDDFITSASPETEPDEADAAFDAKEKKKKQSNIISRIILIICACVFVFAAVKLVSILLEYKKGNDIYNNIEGDVLDDTPVNITIDDDEAPEVTIPFVYNHQALLDINSDGLGFLYVPSVDIRLPVAQTTDNDFYLTHTFDKTIATDACSLITESRMVLMPAMFLSMDTIWAPEPCLALLPDIKILVSTRQKVMMFFIFIQRM